MDGVLMLLARFDGLITGLFESLKQLLDNPILIPFLILIIAVLAYVFAKYWRSLNG